MLLDSVFRGYDDAGCKDAMRDRGRSPEERLAVICRYFLQESQRM